LAVLQVKIFPALDTPLEPAPEQKAPPRTVPRADFFVGAGFALTVGFGFTLGLGATLGAGLAEGLGAGLADGLGAGLAVCLGVGRAVFCGVGTAATLDAGVEDAVAVAVGGMSLVPALVAVASIDGLADSVAEALGEAGDVDAWVGITVGAGLLFAPELQAATERDSAAIASRENGFFKFLSWGIPFIKT